MNSSVVEAEFNIIIWALVEEKLFKNCKMIRHGLEKHGALTRSHTWGQPWFLIASIPGLAGEVPTGYSFLAYPEAAAQYVMPPMKQR